MNNTIQKSPNIIDILPGLESLWSQTTGNPEIGIAILDGPADRSHPCFTGAFLSPVETLLSGGSSPGGGALKHGTAVASILFAQHNSDVKGVAPRCRGFILPVFRDGKQGGIRSCSQMDLARVITQAASLGVRVINISGGQFDLSGQAERFLTDAVNSCVEKGILIIAAAGNEGCDCLHVPAAMPQVLAVGAADAGGKPINYSNWGAKYGNNGILAPGENIPTAVPGAGYSKSTGTSFATPIVSGIAALLLSIQMKKGLKPDPYAVRDVLLQSTTACNPHQRKDCQRFLAGVLDIERAGTLIASDNSKTVGISRVPLFPGVRRGGEGIRAAGMDATKSIVEIPLCTTMAEKVYAVGTLGYDFGCEARKDSLKLNMEKDHDPRNADQLLEHLKKNPRDTSAVTWTLNLDAIAIYAIAPTDPFTLECYKMLREFLEQQLKSGVERISVPGIITAQTRLMSGQVVPVITPDIRGMYSWSTDALVKQAIAGAKGPDKQISQNADIAEGIKNFLARIYFEIRNMGVDPGERALNFAATNAYFVVRVFKDAFNKSLNLSGIDVQKSSICRPNSDCRDVIMHFFDPKNKRTRARRMYRFTIDVSDVIPVTLGEVRSWNEY